MAGDSTTCYSNQDSEAGTHVHTYTVHCTLYLYVKLLVCSILIVSIFELMLMMLMISLMLNRILPIFRK